MHVAFKITRHSSCLTYCPTALPGASMAILTTMSLTGKSFLDQIKCSGHWSTARTSMQSTSRLSLSWLIFTGSTGDVHRGKEWIECPAHICPLQRTDPHPRSFTLRHDQARVDRCRTTWYHFLFEVVVYLVVSYSVMVNKLTCWSYVLNLSEILCVCSLIASTSNY